MPDPIVASQPLAALPPAVGQTPVAGPQAPTVTQIDVLAKGQFGTFFGLDAKQKTLPKAQAMAIAKVAGFSSVGAFQRFIGIKNPDHAFGEQTFLKAREFLIQEADKAHPAGMQDRLSKLAFRLLPADHPAIAKLADNPQQKVVDAFGTFVKDNHQTLADGMEADCADFAGYLWHRFTEAQKVPNPLPGDFVTYTKNSADDGVFGVSKTKPTIVNDVLYAADFERRFAEPIPLDREGTATTGITFKAASQKIDFGQLKPGDLIFYGNREDGAFHVDVIVENDTQQMVLKKASGSYKSVKDSEGNRIGINPIAISYDTVDYGKGQTMWGGMGVYQVKSL